MPTLAEHHSSSVVKLLNIGESKSGKTGSLASLASVGYNLWIIDLDNGLDILRNVLSADAAALKRITYQTLRDETRLVNGLLQVKTPPTAYKAIGKILQEWDVENLGAQDILVIDTLTTLSDAAFNQALMLAGRLNQRPQLQDYGWLADSVKLLIDTITSSYMKCNVIVNSHVKYFGKDDEEQTSARGLPNAKGQEISRIVSRYFNTVVLTRSMGTGPATKRIISTRPQGVVEVATSNPLGVKPEYPVEGGLAPLFRDILGHSPEVSKK